jgi:Ca2+-transporting ATPase
MEEAEEDIMTKPPRNAKEGIFSNGLGFDIVYQGVIIALLTVISFFIGKEHSQVTGMTMAFLTLSACEVFHSLNLRSRTKSIFRLKNHNKFLIGAMILSFMLSVAVIYIPGLNNIFELTPLSARNFSISIAIAFTIIPIVEICKLIRSMFLRKQ